VLKLVDIFDYVAVVLSAGTLLGQSLLLGGLVFLCWIARPSPDVPPEGLVSVRAFTLRWFRFAALGLVAVELLYLYVNTTVLMASAEIPFTEATGAAFFIAGSIILLAALGAAIAGRPGGRYTVWLLTLFVLIVLGASVMTDHAASRIEGRVPLIILTALHEGATGFWIGGLPFLLLGLYINRDRTTQWLLTRRFSQLALISVVVLVFSGLGMSLKYMGSWGALIGTSYGLLLLAKITMLGAMLALGGINFLMLRRHGPEQVIPRLRRLVEAEVGIGITIVLSAASMTAQPPAIDLPNDVIPPSHIWARYHPVWPRFAIPKIVEHGPGQGNPDTKIVAYTTEGLAVSARDLDIMHQSEANHHWMGLIVLGMGILAVLARTGHAPWAEYWPLLMIGIAVFILLLGDPECWPLGPMGFWSTWADPEIFQHRMAALLCIGFAIFELRVRRSPQQQSWQALIFPMICAAGAALLLTHSHDSSNVREETMAELSHTPMAVLGVMAGWSRWLELRLPSDDRRFVSWIWPVCFVLIGAGLLNYREF